MAGKSVSNIYVVDTSYLLELFKVDGKFNNEVSEEIKTRFENAVSDNHMLFVPLPCIYELGNHIANITNGNLRRELASTVLKTIERCVNNEREAPWTITPSTGVEGLRDLWGQFAGEYINYTRSTPGSSIGLIDAATIHEASRLKQEYKTGQSVYIWTRDSTMKSHEPDKEPDPFV